MSGASEIGAGSPRALASAYLCRRYEILFYTLLLTIVAAPLVAALDLPGALLELLLAANLLAAVMPISTGRGRRVLLATLAVLMVARAATAWFGFPAFSVVTLGLWTLLAMFAASGALRFAMRAATIDAEHLYAALSAYLLAGIFFVILYWVLEHVEPGTFAATAEFSRMSAIYFSFVTLATLGYGDIVPRTDIARGFAIVEGVGGQFFLAVMVARLVSLYGRERAAG